MSEKTPTSPRLRKAFILAAAGIILILLLGVAMLQLIPFRPAYHPASGTAPLESTDGVSPAQWEALTGKAVFFGHQSVGYNILEGVESLMAEDNQIRLTISETTDPRELGTGVFAHAPVGKNRDPMSKIIGFRDQVENGIGGKADIAFMKFCYIDICDRTDIEAMFTEYRSFLDELAARYPKTRFLHVTTPLWAPPTSLKQRLKDWVKSLLGRSIYADDNRVREQYNDMLREAWGDSGNLIDLARAESTAPDGRLYRVATKQGDVPALIPDYTTDGGHLNAEGRRQAARHMLAVLARVASETSKH